MRSGCMGFVMAFTKLFCKRFPHVTHAIQLLNTKNVKGYAHENASNADLRDEGLAHVRVLRQQVGSQGSLPRHALLQLLQVGHQIFFTILQWHATLT